ncbi:MAG: AtpZ/AtpI family protein [Desulfobacterales bacterium]|nr:AtpZ/AtpI family protein [Desulfobacterales bacterium]MBS3755547.1 AtpZ/AtpI family protein [Desulfobacterales bacterium]
MKRETRQMFRELAYYSSLGFSVALAIFIGLFIGLGLDRLFNSTPVFMFIFLGFGILAGFSNIYRAMKRSRNI